MNKKNPFIDSFRDKLKDIPNPNNLIENEISQIRAFTTTKHIKNKLDKFGLSSNKTNSVFDLSQIGNRDSFNEIFKEISIYGTYELDENNINFRFKEPLLEKAKMFVEYLEWLIESKSEHKKKTNSKSKPIPHKQQMLILYYLGLDMHTYEKTNLSKLLFQLFGLNADNTRKYLSYVSAGKNDVRTIKNLKSVKNLFESLNFIDISIKIQKELDGMKK